MPKVTKVSEMIKSLKGVIAALASLAQNLYVCLLQCALLQSVFFCREGQQKTREASTQMGNSAGIVKLFPRKGIFTLPLSWMM